MFRNIIGTIGAKVANAIFGLILVTVNANYLGAEGVGVISLIILGITIILLISEMIGGGALIYLVPRIRTINLLVPSYIWALISTLLFYGALNVLPLLPEEYYFQVCGLGLLHSLGMIHLYILLGNKRIFVYNFISTFQTGVTLLIVVILYVYKQAEIAYFVKALYIAYAFTYLSSLVISLANVSFSKPTRLIYTIRWILRHSGYNQIANILQLLNYRLSYYLIEAFLGKAALGKFSVGTQLSESVLLVSKSVSTVQYAHISNIRNLHESQRLTTVLMKLTFIVTAILFAILIIIPDSAYTYIFGEEFLDIPVILMWLFAGIVALAVLNIGSHYFSGIGKHYINSISSGIGFVGIVIFCLLLIPKYGLPGAAIATSLSYILSSLFVLIVFLRELKSGPKTLLINREDIQLIKRQILKQLDR